jgi:cyclase
MKLWTPGIPRYNQPGKIRFTSRRKGSYVVIPGAAAARQPWRGISLRSQVTRRRIGGTVKLASHRPFVAIAFLLLGCVLMPRAYAQAPPLTATPPQTANHFEQVADGVYFAIPTWAAAGGGTGGGSNSVVIVNDEDVFLVDAHTSPIAAQALVADIKTITNKPIRFVVNTHFHFDHTLGNQIFGPNVTLIGSDFTRHQLMSNPLHMRSTASFLDPLPQRAVTARQQAAAEKDPQKKAALTQQAATLEAAVAALKDVVVTPVNLMVHDKLTMLRGSREIQILFLGRGHTGGDLVVYLPKEKIVCTGDLMEPGIAFGGDSYPQDWFNTLNELKKLDFDTVLSGHGPRFSGKQKIDAFQLYLSDLWTQAETLKKQGVPADEASKRIDLTSHKADFPNIQAPGVDVRFVTRIYDLLDGNDIY